MVKEFKECVKQCFLLLKDIHSYSGTELYHVTVTDPCTHIRCVTKENHTE